MTFETEQEIFSDAEIVIMLHDIARKHESTTFRQIADRFNFLSEQYRKSLTRS